MPFYVSTTARLDGPAALPTALPRQWPYLSRGGQTPEVAAEKAWKSHDTPTIADAASSAHGGASFKIPGAWPSGTSGGFPPLSEPPPARAITPHRDGYALGAIKAVLRSMLHPNQLISVVALGLSAAVLCAPAATTFLALTSRMPHALALLAPLATHGAQAAALASCGIGCVIYLPLVLVVWRFLTNLGGISHGLRAEEAGIDVMDAVLRLGQFGCRLLGGIAFGAALAPLLAGAALPGAASVAAVALPMAMAGLMMQRLAVDHTLDGNSSPTLAMATASAIGAGLTTLTYSFLAGATASAAVSAGIGFGASLVVLGVIAASLRSSSRLRPPTVLADSHVVPVAYDGATKHVYGTPDALHERIAQLRAKAREDEEGHVYWPGQPILNWLTTEGAGQSVHGAFLAQSLGADLIRLTGAQLRCMEAPGYQTLSISYFLTLWLQAEGRAIREGRPQVILLENVAHLLPKPKDVADSRMFAACLKVLALTLNLSAGNPGRHRTILVFTGSDDGGNNSVRKYISPAKAIWFAPLTPSDRRGIIDDAVETLKQVLARDSHEIAAAFWTSAKWQKLLATLSTLDCSGRFFEDTIDSLQVVTAMHASGQHLEHALLHKLEQDLPMFVALAAARSATLSSSSRPHSDMANDDYMAYAAQCMADPNFASRVMAGNLGQQIRGMASVADAARSRYIGALFSQAIDVFTQQTNNGNGVDEVNDYNAAWCDAFDEAISSQAHAKRDVFSKAYVCDIHLPSFGPVHVGRRFESRRRVLAENPSMSMDESIDNSFYGRNRDMPMLQDVAASVAARMRYEILG